eukprot:3673158-Pyramimonas_sp.AAC.1
MRLGRLKGEQVKLLETEIPRRVKRKVGPPPAHIKGKTMAEFARVVFDPEADYHKRAGGKRSQMMDDVDAVCEMVNGDLTSGAWTHWCWDCSTSQPCCRNLAETVDKTTVSVVNILATRSTPIPSESRWTNTLTNFKATLLRKALHGIG